MEDRLHRIVSMAVFVSFLTLFMVLHVDALNGSFDDKGLYKVVIEREKVQAQVTSDGVSPEVGSIKGKPSSVIMYNKKGKPFRCVIPDRQLPVDEKDKLNDLDTTLIEDALKPATTKSGDRNCVNLVTSGWWHYEFCFGKHVTQYHLEKGEVVPPVIFLGQFSHAFNWSNVSRKSALGRKDRHHTQYYVNGSECDINGKQRRADVKIYCDSNNWGSDYIESVREPESCAYEVIVYSKRLCNVSYFRKDKPVVGQIICNPVGSTSSKEQLSLEQVVNSNDKVLLGFGESSSSSEEIGNSAVKTEGQEAGTDTEQKVPVVNTPKRLEVDSLSDDVSPNPYISTTTSADPGDVTTVLKVDSEDDDFGGDEYVLEELREAREAVKARGRLTLDEEVAVETVFKSHGYIQNAKKLEGKEQAAALLRVMQNLRKILKMLEDEDTDEGFTAIMYKVTSLLLKQARNASGELVYGKDRNRGVHAEQKFEPETKDVGLPKEAVPEEDLYTDDTSPPDFISDVVLVLQKADRLREMRPYSSTEATIYDLLTEADEQTQAWGAVEDDNPAKQQLWNEAREGWAITRFYVNQRRRLEDKNIRKEFEDNIVWITDWKIKTLESVSKMRENFENTIYNKFTGDVRHTDPWWRPDDDASYHAYPFGVFDMWVPRLNEFYPDEKEVVLNLMKAQIESYLFTGPEEAALMAGHNRMPGFQHALALVERAMKDITDPEKEMARSFRQILFPHIRRMVSLLESLVEWSKQNRKDAEYRMATKALDQQFSAAVTWAAGMTGVVNAIRDAEKKHFGNERGERFRNYPDELNFYDALKYKANKPKFPLLPSEKHLDKSYFEEPLDMQKFTLDGLPDTSDKTPTLASENAELEDDLVPLTEGLTEDEKMVVKAFNKLYKASMQEGETEWGVEDLEEQTQVFGRRRQFAENAVKFLKDERRNFRDTFRQTMVGKMENIAQRYGDLEQRTSKLNVQAKETLRRMNKQPDDSDEELVNIKISYGKDANEGALGTPRQAAKTEDGKVDGPSDLTNEFQKRNTEKRESSPKASAGTEEKALDDSEQSLEKVLEDVIRETGIDMEDVLDEVDSREMEGLTDDEMLVARSYYALILSARRFAEGGFTVKKVQALGPLFSKLRLLAEKALAALTDDERSITSDFREDIQKKMEFNVRHYSELERQSDVLKKDLEEDDARDAKKVSEKPLKDTGSFKTPVEKAGVTAKVANQEIISVDPEVQERLIVASKAERLGEMEPFSSAEQLIYDMFIESDQATMAWAVSDEESERHQLMNEAKEAWAITRHTLEQRKRLGDKNIRQEFAEIVLWICEWKSKTLKSLSTIRGASKSAVVVNEFTGDVRSSDPWWRPNDDASYHAYPFGVFDIWVPHMNELYPDEKEVVLSILKAQIESYRFSTPEEAARMSADTRLPAFQHASALIESAVKDLTDPQKQMGKSFRQLIYPHARRISSLLQHLVRWSQENKKDSQYVKATKLLDEQFAAVVQWAGGMTKVVTTIRGAEKSHFGNERGERFRNHPNEIDFFSYLEYEKNKPKFPLLPVEETGSGFMTKMLEKPFDFRMMMEEFIRKNPENVLTLADEDIEVDGTEDMGPYPDTLTDDETAVVKALARSDFITSIVRSSGKYADIDPKVRSQVYSRSRLLAEKALAILNDENKNIRNEFKQKLLSKVEKIVSQYGDLEKKALLLDEMKKDNEKLRAANNLLSDPDVDIEDWKNRFAETFERAIGRVSNGKQQPKALAPSAKSKAQTFDEVLGNMDPKQRRLKEMEDVIRDRLSDFLGTGDVTFALMPANGAPGQVLKGMDMNKLQNILNENNKQLQFVHQQENNYNLDDEDE